MKKYKLDNLTYFIYRFVFIWNFVPVATSLFKIYRSVQYSTSQALSFRIHIKSYKKYMIRHFVATTNHESTISLNISNCICIKNKTSYLSVCSYHALCVKIVKIVYSSNTSKINDTLFYKKKIIFCCSGANNLNKRATNVD